MNRRGFIGLATLIGLVPVAGKPVARMSAVEASVSGVVSAVTAVLKFRMSEGPSIRYHDQLAKWS